MFRKYTGVLLILLYGHTALQAQYPVTQAVRPLKLTDVKTKVVDRLPFSGVEFVTSSMQDSTAIGFVTADEIGRAQRLVPDTNIHRWLQTFVRSNYGDHYTASGPHLLCVIEDLRIQQQQGNPDGVLHLKASAYSTPVRENRYQLTRTIDTIVAFRDTSSRSAIAQVTALLLQPDETPQLKSKTFTREELVSPPGTNAAMSVMRAREYKTGAYLSYDDFRNNRPSVENITVQLDRATGKFNVYEVKDSTLKLLPACWGLTFNNELYICYQDMLLPAEKQNNTIMLSSWVTPDRRQNRAMFWRWVLEKAGTESQPLRDDIFDKVYRKGVLVAGTNVLATRLDADKGTLSF